MEQIVPSVRKWMADWAAAWRLADTDVPHGLTRKAVVLDLAERALVAVFFFAFVYRLFFGSSGSGGVFTILLAGSEVLPFVYVMLRIPSTTLSQRPSDWIIGILGSVVPLLVTRNQNAPLTPVALVFCIMVAGLTLQVMAKVVLGRAFGIVAANRGVRVMGPYRLIRHPMYAGYILSQVGYLLARPSLVNAIVYAAGLSLQIMRILREERVLLKDARYSEFAARVRYRLLPCVF